MAGQAVAQGIELAMLIQIPANARFFGDAGRVRQVLLNLVSNAVKFTHEGSVTIEAYLADDADEADRALVRFEVRDTGVGIAPGVLPRLFKPFMQADGSTTRRYGGTGLGLAISKRLVEMMGGEIEAESVEGQGSTLSFSLPLPHDREAEAKLAITGTIRGRRLLLADADAASRQSLRQQLEAWGVAVTTVRDGATAMARLRSAALQRQQFDIVLVDLSISEGDEAATIQAIQATAAIAETPVVVLTEPGRSAAEVMAAGVAGALSRPVRPSQLHECLLAVLQDRRPGPTPTRESVTADGQSSSHRPRLLVAEDNAVNQKVAARMLEKLDYRVDVVADGREAVEALRRVPYAAVLMDCQMPEMDGYEATAAIRCAEGGSRRTPIIAMTASAMQGDRERCLAAGMDDYVTKPIRQGDLATVLQRWVDAGSSL
jgi:CheY-like chemotaxis protein